MKLINKLNSIPADKLKPLITKVHNSVNEFTNNIEKLKSTLQQYKDKLQNSNDKHDKSAALNIKKYEQIIDEKLKLNEIRQKFEVSQNDSEEYKEVFIEYMKGRLKYYTLEILTMYNDSSDNKLMINGLPNQYFLQKSLNSISSLLNNQQVPMRIKLENGSFAPIKYGIYIDENGEEKNINLAVDYHRIEYDNFTDITNADEIYDWLLFILKGILTGGILPIIEFITEEQYVVSSSKYQKEHATQMYENHAENLLKSDCKVKLGCKQEFKEIGISL